MTETCDCPFNPTCHLPRQWLRVQFRKDGTEETIHDCPFYQKKMEATKNE